MKSPEQSEITRGRFVTIVGTKRIDRDRFRYDGSPGAVISRTTVARSIYTKRGCARRIEKTKTTASIGQVGGACARHQTVRFSNTDVIIIVIVVANKTPDALKF